jgi:hypothetical protein
VEAYSVLENLPTDGGEAVSLLQQPRFTSPERFVLVLFDFSKLELIYFNVVLTAPTFQ